jgi:hypothetical protein
MGMYDTIKIFVEGVNCKDDKLSNVFERLDEGGLLVGGKLKNLDVKCGCRGLSVQGSLAKYYLPSNAHTMTRGTTKEAVECLSDDLGVDVSVGVCSRADISAIIPTRKPPNNYFRAFGDMPRFKRLETAADTLTYRTQNKEFIFYDKIKEMLHNGNRQQVEQDLRRWGLDDNVLRIEMQKKNLSRQFKGGLRVNQLYNETQYYSFVKEWGDTFKTIKTRKTMKVQEMKLKTPKEAVNLFIAMKLKEVGDVNIVAFIEELKSKNVFADRRYYTRVKQGLFDLMGVNGCCMGDDDYKEIKEAVDNIVRYAR